ncbi:DsbA family oxidoreductase [Egibacter rhizosphaerae]|uniref:DsbA family oxidoreductase n=1 Tax=Egibacter rhizosphaerae TaxID=1670831 RepID=UPI00197AC521|nr:DsbA family oxidoreductase [Egibacter rhizosphaerae]
MQVEIWSDVVCPWCAIGKRRFEQALARFPHRDAVEVRWRSFELDPSAPTERPEPLLDHLAAKYGTDRTQAQAFVDRMAGEAAKEGLDFHLDRARPGNTFDAHRLLHLAADRGLQDAVKTRFMVGYLTEGQPVGDPGTLATLAVDAGLGEAEVRDVLAGDAYATEVRADESTARSLGIAGVPFFVVDRAMGASGAQPADTLLQLLERGWEAHNPLTLVGSTEQDGQDGEACGPDGCAPTPTGSATPTASRKA